ncbi:component of SufBCD complex [Pseudogemmobacter blasticus]|uniref:Component of SufBCD complex n=1 Tax=Fuscovulum blasticum DSM 2131 TaxID=1188250 RepID=A0A2T4JAM9_FUSBL|nr:component of SufBCD complex [Fuscovulum blasticum]AWD20591.1 component of SufBCD complex [Fuscovulum blasticum]PTE14965.1 component of SufBCD complex [Fuscovulum blasticum DSM 2131]
MDWYQTIIGVIDTRSFSSIWYWIVVAVLWSVSSYWVMGVPYDMLQKARRHGGQAQTDVETLAEIHARRLLDLSRQAAVPLFALVSFLLTSLVVLGFWYGIQLAQALFCLALPMVPIGWLSLRTALKIEAGENTGRALYHRLMYHRRSVQVVGMLAIFFTGMFGSYQIMHVTFLH